MRNWHAFAQVRYGNPNVAQPTIVEEKVTRDGDKITVEYTEEW